MLHQLDVDDSARAGLRHVRTVRPKRAANFRVSPFWGGKKLHLAKIVNSFALKLFQLDPSPQYGLMKNRASNKRTRGPDLPQ